MLCIVMLGRSPAMSRDLSTDKKVNDLKLVQNRLDSLRAQKAQITQKLVLQRLERFQNVALQVVSSLPAAGASAVQLNGYLHDAQKLHAALSEIETSDFWQVTESSTKVLADWDAALEKVYSEL